jgi:hypothetical protein
MPTGARRRPFRGKIGSRRSSVRVTRLTPMYGPAVRCKSFVDLAVGGLASMYPVSSWSCFAPDHHGYQRACDLISGQASIGPQGNNSSAPNVEQYAIPPRGLGRHSGNWCRGYLLMRWQPARNPFLQTGC